jgi:hypothetical protein
MADYVKAECELLTLKEPFEAIQPETSAEEAEEKDIPLLYLKYKALYGLVKSCAKMKHFLLMDQYADMLKVSENSNLNRDKFVAKAHLV